MLKNNKGITLVALGVTILVIMIIVTITLDSGRELIKNSERNKIKTNLYLIQSRAEELLETYLFEIDDPLSTEITNETKEQYLKGNVINGITEVQDVGFETRTGNYIYCRWGVETLKAQGIDVSKMDEDDIFIIQYSPDDNEVDVATVKGFSVSKDIVYHKLSEF